MAEKKSPLAESGTDLDTAGWIAHGITAALGVLGMIAAYFAERSGIQSTLTVALIVGGGLLIALSYLSAVMRSRAAWSFVISLAIVLAIMTLFGAPKIRTLVGINLGIALVIPALFLVAAVLLSAMGHRYNKT
jgi:hypothetical protein